MNYIHQLQAQLSAYREATKALEATITDVETYYTSSKFHGSANDYAHVSTDVLKRLNDIKQSVGALTII